MDSPQGSTEGYALTTDVAAMDVARIHHVLSEDSYWAKGIPLTVVEKSLKHSLCFALLAPGGGLAAFARVISDRATYAYLCDLFVEQEHRGLGLSQALLRAVLDHPELQDIRRWSLATRDAHALYARFGFAPLARPETFMERRGPEPYARN